MPPWPNAPPKLVQSCVSAGSASRVGNAIKAYAPDMMSILRSLTKLVMKSKTWIGSVPSHVWFVRVRLKFFK